MKTIIIYLCSSGNDLNLDYSYRNERKWNEGVHSKLNDTYDLFAFGFPIELCNKFEKNIWIYNSYKMGNFNWINGKKNINLFIFIQIYFWKLVQQRYVMVAMMFISLAATFAPRVSFTIVLTKMVYIPNANPNQINDKLLDDEIICPVQQTFVTSTNSSGNEEITVLNAV